MLLGTLARQSWCSNACAGLVRSRKKCNVNPMLEEPAPHLPWTASEVDLIVSDYFAMLSAELQGRRYVKAQHNAALQSQIARGRASIEFKYCNVSAVLEELGQPIIRGYLPRANYQSSLVLGVQRYLECAPALEDQVLAATRAFLEAPHIFIDSAPDLTEPKTPPKLSEMQRLLHKFDPAKRDARNRRLGAYGEEAVYKSERGRLSQMGRDDLARRVRWVSKEDGDGAGYDILSFDDQGRERFLEVKTTLGSRKTPFFISRNEKEFSDEAGDRFRIYRRHDAAKSPRAFLLAPPLEQTANLAPQVWRASFA
jgi:hypothetical protein